MGKTRRRLLTLVFAGLSVIQSGAATAAASGRAFEAGTSPQVRTDGIYYLVHPNGAKNAKGAPLGIGVRFYNDHTAIESEFYGDPTGLAKWFNRDNATLLPGRWILAGDE
ncbi:MAG: hypothetical protein ACREB3_03895, partial [Burkholderiales bacterium]